MRVPQFFQKQINGINQGLPPPFAFLHHPTLEKKANDFLFESMGHVVTNGLDLTGTQIYNGHGSPPRHLQGLQEPGKVGRRPLSAHQP